MSRFTGKEFTYKQGVGQATNGATNATILAAAGADNKLYLEKAVVTVYTAATGGSGIVALEDGSGGTKFWRADADALGNHVIDFGERGYALTANTLLNLTVEGAVTNDAFVSCTAVAHVAPDGY